MRIAISGHSGCGNTTATANVGKALDLKVVNYTFRDLARDLGLNFEELHREAATNLIYDYLTDLVLIRQSLIHPNIVIGTRLAAWLMEAELHIWLQAPLEVRASRINLRETEKSSSQESVLYKTMKRDQQNQKRYLRLYGIDIEDHSDFDITINTEKLAAQQVSNLVVAAAQWATTNKSTPRHNVHLERIREIISENLKLPLEALTDPNYPIDIRELYNKHKNSLPYKLY